MAGSMATGKHAAVDRWVAGGILATVVLLGSQAWAEEARQASTLPAPSPAVALQAPNTTASGSDESRHSHSAAADFARGEAIDMASFLDRLMMAESGGRDTAKNPRSTATGPFQFIEATFIQVVRRHFHDETARFTDAELLARRSDRAFARRAAEAYTRDNAAALASAGHVPTFANLRLAFLLGPEGAGRVLRARTDAKLPAVLAQKVIAANPFMKPMTAGDLVRRASREVSLAPGGRLAATVVAAASGATSPRPSRPRIVVRCKVSLASCRAWVARQERKLARKVTRQAARR
ncbi:MAG: hypothetical protein R3D27_11330 [Hyphomicrobiaceae bacterium]